MNCVNTTKCIPVLLMMLVVLFRPIPLNAHDSDNSTYIQSTDTTHLEHDVAPTLDEEAELLERVEREGLGINPNSTTAARMFVDPGQLGQWGPVQDWPVNGVFTSVMPDGRVLVFDSVNDDPVQQSENHTFTRAMVWTPSTGAIERIDVDTGWNLFCAGFATLPDGRTFIAGGNLDSDLNGIEETHTFNHLSNTWARGQKMDFARWYPAVTPLANGEMLITGGGFAVSEVREVDGQIRTLPGASAAVWDNRLYPWLQTAPDGRVLFLGPDKRLGYVDTSGSGTWQATATRDSEFRSYGSYAMYDVGLALVAGGGIEDAEYSQQSARIIDMYDSSSTSTGDMNYRRRQHNLTVLADGSVLATGGFSSNKELVDLSTSVFAAESWNPETGQWSVLAAEERARQYHSTAILLPDGRVLSAGGGICGSCQQAGYMQRNAQVFSPPYLFNKDGSGTPASRPQIDSVPTEVRYNQAITVNTTQAANIDKVALIRTSSVTHSQNMEQRYLPLQFTANGNALNVQTPANANIAPPGHYMLFIIDSNGVPSVAPIIRLSQSLENPGEIPGAINHALDGVASASSNSDNASFAIDGVTDGDLANTSVFSSEHQNQPWWQVDLGDIRNIDQIALHRRTDCCADRLSGVHVLVSDSPLPEDLSDAMATPDIHEYYVASFSGIEKRLSIAERGRYIRVQLAGTEQLELAEVEVLDSGGDEQCGNPNVNPQTTGGVYIWKSCDGVWSVQLTGESGLNTVAATGEIDSTYGFINLDPFKTEPTDTLQQIDDERLLFDIRTANPWSDQFNFTVPNNDELCIRLASVTKEQSVFVGRNRIPAPNGAFNPVTIEPCDRCAAPDIDRDNDFALTTWIDCFGKLHLYATAGQDSATFKGRVTNAGVFTDSVGYSLEASDSLTAVTDSIMAFDIKTGGGAFDEIVLTGTKDYCVSPDALSNGVMVYTGPDRQTIEGPFNPRTLQPCETPQIGCGDPFVDPTSDPGFFVWNNCDGSFRIMVTGTPDGTTVKYTGNLTSSTGFSSVIPISLESSDNANVDTNVLSFDVQTSYPWQDQFAFTPEEGADLCLTLSAIPFGSQAFVGPNRDIPSTMSFDPDSGGPCL